MKMKHWLAGCACLAGLAGTPAWALPQTENITVTVRVDDDGKTTVETKKHDEAAADKSKDDSSKERKAIHLQMKKGPVVMMRRVALANEDKKSDTSESDKQAADEKAPPKIWLGIGLKEVEGDLATYLGTKEGVFVESVFPDSPAAAAKMQEGDIIVEFQGQKVAGPSDLVDALHKVKGTDSSDDKSTRYPSVSVTVLRRGEQTKLELTPTERPKDLKVSRFVPGSPWAEGADIFKFAQPDNHGVMLMQPIAKAITNATIIIKEDDKQYTVRIERSDEGAAKIVVNDGSEERRYDEKELDKLPEKVRDAVTSVLSNKGFTFKADVPADESEDKSSKAKEQAMEEVHQQIEKAMKQLGGKLNLELKDLDALKGLEGIEKGRVIVIDPNKLQDIRKLSEDAKSMAKKWAEVGAEQAQSFANMPEQVKSLKKEVEELKKQVEELRAQLKASK